MLGLGATALTGNAEDMHGVALVQMQAAVAGAMHVMLRGASAMGAAVLAVAALNFQRLQSRAFSTVQASQKRESVLRQQVLRKTLLW